MLDGDYQPAARLAQHAKDVDLIREVALRIGAKTPLSEVHAAILGQAIANGWGDLDNSAVMKVYQEAE
jgi:3-hydroxyisobutyrate dehydrogenase-like beta-hydroxyacid dehydrogenase